MSDDLDQESLRRAVRQSVVYLERLAPERIVGAAPMRFTAGEIRASLLAFDEILDRWDCRECWLREVAERFEFIPSASDPATAEVLFTGYYQPVIEASLAPAAEYPYPIYRVPDDLIAGEQVTVGSGAQAERIIGRLEGENFLPYYSRSEIDALGVLRGRGYEIAWVKDPVELFFLHIQGSGMLQLADGRRLQVGYAGANGRPYRSIGRLLIDQGKIAEQEMSMQRLYRYLRERPEEQGEVFAYNESYVFFRFLEDGPLGSLDVPVTPGRTLATDARIFPKGALAFIATQAPLLDAGGDLAGWRPLARFVLNQDTGGAIRGPQRADLYFGSGAAAGAQAGYMNSRGRLYFLALKNSAAAPR